MPAEPLRQCRKNLGWLYIKKNNNYSLIKGKYILTIIIVGRNVLYAYYLSILYKFPNQIVTSVTWTASAGLFSLETGELHLLLRAESFWDEVLGFGSIIILSRMILPRNRKHKLLPMVLKRINA